VRFDSARAAGLTESRVARIKDGYEAHLSEKETAALQLVDMLVGLPQVPAAEVQERLKAHFSEAEIVELALGMGVFQCLAKVLINLGLEPEDMPVTVVPTPGTPMPRDSSSAP